MRNSSFVFLAALTVCSTWSVLTSEQLCGDEPAGAGVASATPSAEATTASPAPQTAGANTAAGAEEATPTANLSQRVHLNFRDEEWLPALGWLAKELHLNLDWQTLPEGKLSLFSTKDYSLAEAEDQINMQLLARGFTLLKRGEVLRLVPMKDIDITLVPRLSPEELEGLEKHQVVRVSIPLEWMVAEKAALEFKPLLSPHGQLFPLATSNRLEVLDAVVNVRELVRLLKQAESDDGRRIRVMEFRLKYRSAAEISSQVRQLIGLQSERSYSSSYQTQLDIEQAKFRAEAVKQLGNNAKDLITEKKTDTFLVVNEKDNSIVVSAPPDKLEMVRQTIETLDKPLPPSESSWQTVTRVKVHPVNGFDPETIQRLLLSLQERGNLAKETRIQHEAAYNRIIAFASPEDHLTISQVIESYRAERRSAAVLPLTVVTPQYAVKAVQLILKNPDRPSTSPGVASDGKFQIEADPDNSRILLWATSEELKEVREFLLSLGETFDQNDSSAKLHVLSIGESDVPQVMERLREVWQQVSDSPLIIERKPTNLQQNQTPSDSDTPPKPTRDRSGTAIPLSDKSSLATSADSVRLVSSAASEPSAASDSSAAQAGVKSSEADPARGDSAGTVPPVRIIEGRDGDVVIVSRDPQAAGAARRLLQQLKPAPGDVRIITLKHAQAMTMRRQLEEMLASTRSAASSKLSTELPLSIEVDTRTNRLIIQHCNARQLEMIQDLIPVLDQPVAADGRLIRQQRLHRVLHRRASEISEVLKDVYRDLLSINDRAFASYSSYRPMGYNQTLAATASNPEYQGLISIGSDAEANLLIVSAPGYLADEIIKLAESLDTPADGPAMAVVSAAGDSSDAKAREALSKILRKR